MPDDQAPKLDYRRLVPRARREPVRWGRLIDQISGVLLVLLLLGALACCVFYPLFAGIIQAF